MRDRGRRQEAAGLPCAAERPQQGKKTLADSQPSPSAALLVAREVA